MRLARRVINDRSALREHARHENILGSHDARFVKKYSRPLQFSFEAKSLAARDSFGSKGLEAREMSIQAPVPDSVSTGRRQRRAPDARKQRPRKKKTRPYLRGEFSRNLRGFKFRRNESNRPCLNIARNLRPERARRVQHRGHIGNRGNVRKRHRLRRQKRRGDHRKNGVFIAGNGVNTADRFTALYFKQHLPKLSSLNR